MTEHTTLTPSGVVADHLSAVNAFDEDAVVATFSSDALVNDARREFWGTDAIRRWVAKEMVGDRVTIEVIETIDHHGQIIVRGRYDGDFDRTNLPGELIMTNYFTIRDEKIDSLFVIRNVLADYEPRKSHSNGVELEGPTVTTTQTPSLRYPIMLKRLLAEGTPTRAPTG